jgi:hypothetical protein
MIMNAVARPDVGKASGTFAMARYLGGIFGIAVLVTIFDRTGGLASPAEPNSIVTPSLSRGRPDRGRRDYGAAGRLGRL